ncbi:MAG TPA: ABC transporter ATP-binding protein [Xanthobacteraceae bacterium]|jgi:putative spermidine/putrescine transport system ATP-binding protein|nr:ABC transporter ATP-binding protein [Xanthobacteraceae bacterium]
MRAPDSTAIAGDVRTAPGRGHSLRLETITHRFATTTAVRDVSLDVSAGELVALLGPSGCGKSTLLRIIAGFIRQSEGAVRYDGEPVDHLPPNRRGAGIVFQNYALFPHMTAAQNVAYGLEARGDPRAHVRARVAEMLALVQMAELAERWPGQLSGGQQQRIALARALAVEPKILLLDEPFGALDKNLRLDMQVEVKRLQRHYGVTTIMVTHDQEEALGMADRIAVINRGAVEQFASPVEVYDRPATLFVNQFVGTTNLVPGIVESIDGGQCRIGFTGGESLVCRANGFSTGARVVVSIRPERLRLATTPGPGRLRAKVGLIMPLGPTLVYDLTLATGTPVRVAASRPELAAVPVSGSEIFLEPTAADACLLFPEPASQQAGAKQ